MLIPLACSYSGVLCAIEQLQLPVLHHETTPEVAYEESTPAMTYWARLMLADAAFCCL